MTSMLNKMDKSISISVSDQTLTAFEKDELVMKFSVSTALNGTGGTKGSEKTPLGRHQVRAKIGDKLPVGAVLVGRRFTGEVYSEELAKEHPDRDWILTRILWLSGYDIGKNRLGHCDSMQRYIYLHGTPDSEPMGTPRSHGCVRMRNQEIISLFNWVPPHCPVDIFE